MKINSLPPLITYLKIISILYIFTSFYANAQSDVPKSTLDSISYADTVWSEIAPELLNFAEVRKMIIYPEEAIFDETEGKVLVKCLVDKDGSIEKTGNISGPPVFYDEIRRVAMYLKFTPGLVNKYPVKVWVTVPFNFKINWNN